MRIKIGYDISYRYFQATPIILMTEVHQSRIDDLERPDIPQIQPPVLSDRYVDGLGNRCCRLVAPPGDLRIFAETIIKDSGQPDPVVPDAVQHQIQDLPYETLNYLLGSRYCETQLLSEDAWRLFGHTPLGWARVQAVCDFVQGICSSTISRPAIRGRQWKRIGKALGYAATLPTSPSRSVGA
jgi:hypothetical protein